MTPDLILVQASSRSWQGGSDYCMAKFGEKTLLCLTLERLQEQFPGVLISVIAPAYDAGNLDEHGATYSYDASPLYRMIEAVTSFPDDAVVLHVMGHHSFFIPETISELLEAIDGHGLAKLADDYPPAIGGDVWRAGALRKIGLDSLSSADLVHPKFITARKYGANTIIPEVSDDALADIRTNYSKVLLNDFDEVTDKAIPEGDRISYHYRVAAEHIKPTDMVLDIAGGVGTGAIYLTKYADCVVCCDKDPAKLDRVPPTKNLIPSLDDIYATHFAAETFDVITSMETLEHLDRPEHALAELQCILKPGGLLILSTPQNKLGHIPLFPAHIREFSLKELTKLCRRYFTIEKVIGLKGGTIWFEDDPIGTNTMMFLRKV